MGTWGTGIYENDIAEDSRAEFTERIEEGEKPDLVVNDLLNSEELDEDDNAMLLVALSDLLLENGIHKHPILDKFKAIAENGSGLAPWHEDGLGEERQAAYRTLLKRMEEPTSKTTETRKKLAKPGDLLRIPLPDGRFAYAQYLKFDKYIGPLVQVFKEISNEPLENITNCDPMFPPVVVGINPPVRSGRWTIIGKDPVQDIQTPAFVNASPDENGIVSRWWVKENGDEREVGRRLPEKYRHCEWYIIWSAESLEKRIADGTRPYANVKM